MAAYVKRQQPLGKEMNYRGLSFWDKFGFWGSISSIVALLIVFFPTSDEKTDKESLNVIVEDGIIEAPVGNSIGRDQIIIYGDYISSSKKPNISKENGTQLSNKIPSQKVSNEKKPTLTTSLSVKQKYNNCNKVINLSTQKIVSTDKRYIVYDNGTVLDQNENLMWLVGYPYEKKSWNFSMECFNDGGESNGWRLPLLHEIEGINKSKITHDSKILKKFSKSEVWASVDDKKPTTFNFKNGYFVSGLSNKRPHYILPVRTHK